MGLINSWVDRLQGEMIALDPQEVEKHLEDLPEPPRQSFIAGVLPFELQKLHFVVSSRARAFEAEVERRIRVGMARIKGDPPENSWRRLEYRVRQELVAMESDVEALRKLFKSFVETDFPDSDIERAEICRGGKVAVPRSATGVIVEDTFGRPHPTS